jgi:hypothetical protein
MTDLREYIVVVYWKGRIHELLATAISSHAALDQALRDNRTLRDAVRRKEASYEVATRRVAS